MAIEQAVEEVAQSYANTILFSSFRNSYVVKRVEAITQRTIWALQEQLKKGDFTPSEFELAFSASDQLDALKIPLSNDQWLFLRGCIDRVDLYEKENQIFVKIMDYKSGNTTFDLEGVYYGLQLQLLVYMNAILELMAREHPKKEIKPAAMLYYNIKDPFVEKQGDYNEEAIQLECLKKLKMSGLVSSNLNIIKHIDHSIEKESHIIPVVLKGEDVVEERSYVANDEKFHALHHFVQKKLIKVGQEILGGNIVVKPVKRGDKIPCEYCKFHSICGFDKKTNGYQYKKLRKLKKEEIWEELCQLDGQKNNNK